MAYTTIDDPSEYFTTTLYTGNATDDRSITNSANAGNFKPDWVWGKNRTSAGRHTLADSSRGPTKNLFSERTDAESTEADVLQAFETNGFQIGSDTRLNDNNANFVAWQWKANGGTTASNTDGDIGGGSVVQANTTAGFSIVLFTGNNTGGSTVGHGLGGVPEVIIAKSRSAVKPWVVYHVGIGNTKSIKLNETTGAATDLSAWSNTTPSSTNFTLGNGDTNHTGTMLAYCFRSIQGYSKFGSYTGNNSDDGTFVYLGFRPAFVIIKESSINGNAWVMYDNKREPVNPIDLTLQPHLASAEIDDVDQLDFVSNGFKMRANQTNARMNNASGATYIYMAFAEHPFVSSEGVPTTAR